MRNHCNFRLLTQATMWFWMGSLQRGCTEDFNERDLLVESCPTTACEARGNSSCIGQNYSSCTDVLCVDACAESHFKDSEVFCQNSACANALFENSRVTCNESKACLGATFINSAVECQPSVDDNNYVSCDGAIWFHCNCCLNWWDYRACPYEIPSCFDEYSENNTGSADIFCGAEFLGRTCKDWGNPICANSSVESIPPTHPADECSAGEEIVECETDLKCQEFLNFSSCSVYCMDEYSCDEIGFDNSTVVCREDESCSGSVFTHSEVTCQDESSCENTALFKSTASCGSSRSCNDGVFLFSAVNCNVNEACSPIWMLCSCCIYPDTCPLNMEPCYDDGNDSPDHFCSTTFLGQTYKDWGNPICSGSYVASPQALHPASTCSENLDIVECLDLGCQSVFYDDHTLHSCTVFCWNDCQNLMFNESTIACYSGGGGGYSPSCYFATFYSSEVECFVYDYGEGCDGAQLYSSTLNCSGSGPCTAQMDDCSCCTNSNNCPLGAEFCFDTVTGSTDSFCRKIQNDPKCQSIPNPICKNYLQSHTPTPVPDDTENETSWEPAPTPAPDDREHETSKGLYGLTALVLIPLILASCFVAKRYCHKSRGSATAESFNTSLDLPPTNRTEDPLFSPGPSVVSQTNIVEGHDNSASVSVDASRQNSPPNGRDIPVVNALPMNPSGSVSYMLSNKDQCRTHIGENKEIPVADALPME